MPYERDGLLVQERRDDVPTRCVCCPSAPRRLLEFRNGPRSIVYVCPASRAAYLQTPRAPGGVLVTGYYRGSLNGC